MVIYLEEDLEITVLCINVETGTESISQKREREREHRLYIGIYNIGGHAQVGW